MLFAAICGMLAAIGTLCAAEDDVGRYDVVWTSPSKDSAGSMPIGNGDISLNVWMEESGDISFYIGKTDAWGDNARLLKVGKVRISIAPNPLGDNVEYRQTLSLRNGEIVFEFRPKASLARPRFCLRQKARGGQAIQNSARRRSAYGLMRTTRSFTLLPAFAAASSLRSRFQPSQPLRRSRLGGVGSAE